jgi:hypothetical protein
LKVLTALLSSLHGRGQATLAAVYMNTGRLASLNTAIGKLFKFFITVISAESTTSKITESRQKIVKKNNGNSSVSVNSLYEMSIRGLQYLVELEKEGSGTCTGVGAKAGIEEISARAGTGTGAGIATGTGTGTGAGTWVSGGSTKGMKELFERHSPLLLESFLPIIMHEKHKKKSTDITNKSDNENDNDDDSDSDNDDNVLHAKERNKSSEGSKNKNENRNKNVRENNRENSFATMEDRDFCILRFLVSSPWGFLGTPHALESLLNVILFSCKRMFLNNNQDVLQMEEKLFSYADMMISLLIPFSYFLYQPSDSQKLFYPNNLFNSFENWDEIFKNSKIEKTVAGDDISENISNLNLNLNLNSDISMSEEDVTILETIKDIHNDSKLQSFWPGLLLSSYFKQSKSFIVDTNDTNTSNNNSNNNNDNNDYSGNTKKSKSNSNSDSDSNSNDNNSSEVKSSYNSNPLNDQEKRIHSLLNVISGKLNGILETFLLRSVWLRSTTLQVCLLIVCSIFITIISFWARSFLLHFIRIDTI